MKKVAIVGVEGSGKTVMLAGLGDLYTYPDEDGYFLVPKNFGTAAYVAEKIARMRRGEWPSATAGDETQGLDWTLKRRSGAANGRPDTICEVSFLDFAGEVYRAAYGISSGGDASLKEQAEELKQYVCGADELIVLINLRDVITNGLGDKRVQEAMWITKSILDTALGDGAAAAPRAAIVLSQADSYASTIEACGGARGVLDRYLPYVAAEYSWLDVFEANAIDKTTLDGDGNLVPAADFTTHGLLPIMNWIRASDMSGRGRRAGWTGQPLPGEAAPAGGVVQLWEGGPYWAEANLGAENPWEYGSYFWWGDVVGYKFRKGVWVAGDGSSQGFSFDNAHVPTLGKDDADLANEGWVAEQDNAWSAAGSPLAPRHDAAHAKWGGEWRVPTDQELKDLCDKCDWTWTQMGGVSGYRVRGRGAYAAAGIFLPCAGYGYGASFGNAGSFGSYWSSVPHSDDISAYALGFGAVGRSMHYYDRGGGRTIRPVRSSSGS